MFFLDIMKMCHECDIAFGISGGMPQQIVKIIHLIYNAIRIAVPIILIIVGMFDMGKAITQQKEDEIKKAQQLLVRKAVAAGLVFLIVSLVGLVFSVASGEKTSGETWKCVDALLSGTCDNKTSSGG